MGSYDGTMRHDYGHPLGDIASGEWEHLEPPGRLFVPRKLLRADAAVRRRHSGNIRGLRRRSSILGLWSSQWQRGRSCQDVGQ